MLEVIGLQAPEGGLLLATAPRWEVFFLPPAKNWGWLDLLSWVLRKSVECRTSTGHYFLQKPVKWYFRASDLETRKKKLWVCSPRSLCPPLRTKQKNQGETSKHKPPHSQTSKLPPRRLEVENGKTWNVVLGKKSIASKKHWSAYRHKGLCAKQKQTRNGRTCLLPQHPHLLPQTSPCPWGFPCQQSSSAAWGMLAWWLLCWHLAHKRGRIVWFSCPALQAAGICEVPFPLWKSDPLELTTAEQNISVLAHTIIAQLCLKVELNNISWNEQAA